jgi:hypothetical protein
MKKTIFFSLAIIMAVSLCSCADNVSDSSAEPVLQASGNAISDSQTESASGQSEATSLKKITIKVSPPEGWKPVEGSVLPVQYLKNTSSFMVKEENFTGDNLDSVVDEALGIYKKSFSDLTVQGDIDNITVDGKEAKKLTFTCVISDMKMEFRYVYLFVDGKTYVITFGDSDDSFDSMVADYDLILGNIKFVSK